MKYHAILYAEAIWGRGAGHFSPAEVRVFPAGNLQSPQEILTKTFLLIDEGCTDASEDLREFENTKCISRNKNGILGTTLFGCQNNAFVNDHLEDAEIKNIDGLLGNPNVVEPVLDELESDETENISHYG